MRSLSVAIFALLTLYEADRCMILVANDSKGPIEES